MTHSVIYFIDTEGPADDRGPGFGTIYYKWLPSWTALGIRSERDGPSACEWIIPEGPAFTLPDEENGLVMAYLRNPSDDFNQYYFTADPASFYDTFPVMPCELSLSACVRIFS